MLICVCKRTDIVGSVSFLSRNINEQAFFFFVETRILRQNVQKRKTREF